jgi:hypothetical protein
MEFRSLFDEIEILCGNISTSPHNLQTLHIQTQTESVDDMENRVGL